MLLSLKDYLDAETIDPKALLQKTMLRIPEYQRDYSWSSDEVSLLWEDILSTYQSAQGGSSAGYRGKGRLHFLGAIVLTKSEDNRSDRLEVIDGQQRLVTLSCLVAVLREYAIKNLDGPMKDSHAETLSYMLSLPDLTTHRARIELSDEQKNEYFRVLVCEAKTQEEREQFRAKLTKSQQKSPVLTKLLDTIKIFAEGLERFLSAEIEPSKRSSRYSDVTQVATQGLVLLRLEVKNPGIAYEVFEGLNARGLELSQSDLIRNKLYAKSPDPNSAATITDLWKRLDEEFQLQAEQFIKKLSDIFYYHLKSKGVRLKEEDCYQEVVNYVEDRRITAADYLRDVTDATKYLADSLDKIETITSTFKNKYACVPILANAGRLFKGDDEAEFLKALEHFIFRKFLIERASLTEYSNDVCEVARRMCDGTVKSIGDFKNFLKGRSSETRFVENFSNFSSTNSKLAFYILSSIENYLSSGGGMKVQGHSKKQHIEHILPQAPSKEHWQHLPEDIEPSEFINRIGNLLILEGKINQKLSNRGFEEKFSGPELSYRQSQLRLPSETWNFLIDGKWTYQSILNRQRYLAQEFALKVWSID